VRDRLVSFKFLGVSWIVDHVCGAAGRRAGPSDQARHYVGHAATFDVATTGSLLGSRNFGTNVCVVFSCLEHLFTTTIKKFRFFRRNQLFYVHST